MASFRPDAVINSRSVRCYGGRCLQRPPKGRAATRFVVVPGQPTGPRMPLPRPNGRDSSAVFLTSTFRPDQPMARVQGPGCGGPGSAVAPAPANVLNIYRDSGANFPGYGTDAMVRREPSKAGGKEVGIPMGINSRPVEPMTRGEVATLIYQGLVAEGEASPLSATNSRSTSICPRAHFLNSGAIGPKSLSRHS